MSDLDSMLLRNKLLIAAMKEVVAIYTKRGFTVTTIQGNGQFHSLSLFLLPT